ncbi:MAG: endolytic transglycosylase MltG [Pseudomonadota bacterium]
MSNNADAVAETSQKPSGKKKKRAHQGQIFVFFQFCFSLVLLALIAVGAVTFFGAREYTAQGPLAAETTYVVRNGASLNQVATGLRRGGVISNSTIFEIAGRATGHASQIKAGEYLIEPGSSMKEVMAKIVSGRAIEYAVTIVEGMTVTKAVERIASNAAFTGDLPAELPPEGALLADTKSFPRGTDRAVVLSRFVDAQAQMVEEVWANRQPDLPIGNINEFMTLASIVEKETGQGEERPLVASVFINRLRRGMRLQSDPTIIYGIFGGEGKPADRPIYRSDIDTPTDYNTYTIDGLPPTPIAIPGRASLEAVANPAQSDYLYFVADGTGGHAFAETLEGHNQNVARWREIERERAAEAAETD